MQIKTVSPVYICPLEIEFFEAEKPLIYAGSRNETSIQVLADPGSRVEIAPTTSIACHLSMSLRPFGSSAVPKKLGKHGFPR